MSRLAVQPVEEMVRQDEQVAQAVKILQDRQAKGEEAKAMRLPPLLEKRRREHLIPNGAFASQPTYDWIHVYQIGEKDSTGPQTYGDTSIIMPDRVRELARDESPRGIIVGAGLLALDQLRSNGVDLGHICRFVKLAPYRIVIDNILGKDFLVLVMRAGSITSSEDLEAARRAGKTVAIYNDQSQHAWAHPGKPNSKAPVQPWTPADYEV